MIDPIDAFLSIENGFERLSKFTYLDPSTIFLHIFLKKRI